MAIYYCDTASAGGDGTTTATTGAQAAFQHIAEVNAASFAAGDSILFKRGCTWREQLTVPSDGSVGLPITFGAYGDGVKPIINGADIIATWADNSTGSYDWEWDAEEALPGDWTSESDTGSDLNISASAAYSGSNGIRITHNDTTNLFVLKTGLGPYESSVYAEFMIRFSSDFAYAAAGSTLFKIFYATDWLIGLNIEGVTEDTSVTVRFTRNKPGYASIGDEVLNVNTWYKIKLVATGIGTVAGVAQLWIGDNKEKEETGIDWSAGYSIDRVQMGNFAKFGGQTKIEGTIDFDAGWVDADGVGGGVANTWKATVTTEPNLVIFNGTRGTKVASVAACNGARKWYWAANVLYTYGTENPNTTYPSQIEAGTRDFGVLTTKDYITLSGLDIRNVNSMGVRTDGADYVTVDFCNITQCYYQGTDINAGGTYITFSNNTVSQAGGVGIAAIGDGNLDHITISGNTVYDCGWGTGADGYLTYNAGIKAWGGANYGGAGESDYITIEHNTVYNQVDNHSDYSGTGIWLDQWGTDGIIRYNKVYSNAAYGIIVENNLDTGAPKVYYNIAYSNNKGISINRNVTGALVYNNVAYGNTLGGLICEGVGVQKTMVNNIFKNNISTGNGVNLKCVLGGENASDGSGNVYLNNCLGVPAASQFVEWGAATFKDTVAAFNTAYGSATLTSAHTSLRVQASNTE